MVNAESPKEEKLQKSEKKEKKILVLVLTAF